MRNQVVLVAEVDRTEVLAEKPSWIIEVTEKVHRLHIKAGESKTRLGSSGLVGKRLRSGFVHGSAILQYRYRG
jgi:hypothetical protein